MSADNDEISAAFEILVEEIETAVDELNEQGAEAFRRGDHSIIDQTLDRAKRLTAFRNRVKDLQREGERLFSQQSAQSASHTRSLASPDQRSHRQSLTQRLERGLRTPEDSYRLPILETLEELGGSARVGEVLNLIAEKMGQQFSEYDRHTLASGQERWRNAAQWCRLTLVREGLLSSDSPHGVWELTEQGQSEVQRIPSRGSIDPESNPQGG
ncbi:MAG: winged helix-turn-helix domain-containing protein [Candidatus Binataceae bacterium]